MGTINFTTAYINQQLGDFMVTPEGGLAVKMVNDTGAVSVKGSLLHPSTTVENGVALQADEFDCIGAMYSDGIADGEEVWVVINGIAEVLLEDSTASTTGKWVFASTVDGRADATQDFPAGGTISSLNEHFKEVGHCLQTNTAGTDVLCLVALHFN